MVITDVPVAIFLGRSTAGAFLVIEAYIKFQTAELDEQMACMEQLSDGELMHIAKGRQPEDVQRMSNFSYSPAINDALGNLISDALEGHGLRTPWAPSAGLVRPKHPDASRRVSKGMPRHDSQGPLRRLSADRGNAGARITNPRTSAPDCLIAVIR